MFKSSQDWDITKLPLRGLFISFLFDCRLSARNQVRIWGKLGTGIQITSDIHLDLDGAAQPYNRYRHFSKEFNYKMEDCFFFFVCSLEATSPHWILEQRKQSPMGQMVVVFARISLLVSLACFCSYCRLSISKKQRRKLQCTALWWTYTRFLTFMSFLFMDFPQTHYSKFPNPIPIVWLCLCPFSEFCVKFVRFLEFTMGGCTSFTRLFLHELLLDLLPCFLSDCW